MFNDSCLDLQISIVLIGQSLTLSTGHSTNPLIIKLSELALGTLLVTKGQQSQAIGNNEKASTHIGKYSHP